MVQEAMTEIDMDVFSRRVGPFFSWLESKIETGWEQSDTVQKDILKEARYLATTMRARFILGLSRDDFAREVERVIDLFELALEAFPRENEEIEGKIDLFCEGILGELGHGFLPKKYQKQEVPAPSSPLAQKTELLKKEIAVKKEETKIKEVNIEREENKVKAANIKKEQNKIKEINAKKEESKADLIQRELKLKIPETKSISKIKKIKKQISQRKAQKPKKIVQKQAIKPVFIRPNLKQSKQDTKLKSAVKTAVKQSHEHTSKKKPKKAKNNGFFTRWVTDLVYGKD